MERKFKTLAAAAMGIFLCLPVLAAQTAAPAEAQEADTNLASLEMIAERMKALSGSLNAMPEPPQLNQVIQIPDGFEKTENKKETEQ